MSKKPKLAVVKDKENPQADGRRQRSQRSREKILRAYWELMLAGDMSPSAANMLALDFVLSSDILRILIRFCEN